MDLEDVKLRHEKAHKDTGLVKDAYCNSCIYEAEVERLKAEIALSNNLGLGEKEANRQLRKALREAVHAELRFVAVTKEQLKGWQKALKENK